MLHEIAIAAPASVARIAKGYRHLGPAPWSGSAHAQPKLSLPPAYSIMTPTAMDLALGACGASAIAISVRSPPVELRCLKQAPSRALGAVGACLAR